MRNLKRLLAVPVLASLLPVMATAHVSFDHAEPKVGAKVAQSPTEITIWFSDDVEPSCCAIEVRDGSGKQVDKKDVHVDPKNKCAVIVSVPSLAAGSYKVVWRAACVDKHKVKGSFKFEVKD